MLLLRAQEDMMEQLTKLGQLKAAGVITEAEFESKKTELLGRLSPPHSHVRGTRYIPSMAKFDRDGFDKMMAELNAEDRAGVVMRSPYEDMEPDPEYLTNHADMSA